MNRRLTEYEKNVAVYDTDKNYKETEAWYPIIT
jgi:hypothetical protein